MEGTHWLSRWSMFADILFLWPIYISRSWLDQIDVRVAVALSCGRCAYLVEIMSSNSVLSLCPAESSDNGFGCVIGRESYVGTVSVFGAEQMIVNVIVNCKRLAKVIVSWIGRKQGRRLVVELILAYGRNRNFLTSRFVSTLDCWWKEGLLSLVFPSSCLR